MLFDYIFLHKSISIILPDTEGSEDLECIIPLAEDSFNKKAEIFLHLNSLRYKFCFTLTKGFVNNKHITSKDLMQFLISFLFLPNYIKVKDRYLVFIESWENGEDEMNDFRERLKVELGKQGIREPYFELRNDGGATGVEEETCMTNPELDSYLMAGERAVNFEKFVKKLIIPESVAKRWIVSIDSGEDFLKKIELLRYLESVFLLQYPFEGMLYSLYRNTDSSLAKTTQENEILKFKVKNGTEYLKLLKETSQWYVNEYHRAEREGRPTGSISSEPPLLLNEADVYHRLREADASRTAIIEWYKGEYEILPKWYKQFGHIIKVFKGKRTFKSLFK